MYLSVNWQNPATLIAPQKIHNGADGSLLWKPDSSRPIHSLLSRGQILFAKYDSSMTGRRWVSVFGLSAIFHAGDFKKSPLS
jgi:hypothetical protein